tara:strand:- start:302 stop:1618 length:1317 start_codon:yes stop_codon:yes gene_type:complete
MNDNQIKKIEVLDIRVPTSNSGLGSDPFHKNPDYSAVYTIIELSSGIKGKSIVFTCGLGNDWIAYGIKQLIKIVSNYSLDDFIKNPGILYKKLLDHHQLRWLGDGVFRMSIGGIINAYWDLWAQVEKKPIWQLLLDLDDETIINCIDWRYLKDSLNKEEALKILSRNKNIKNINQEKLSTNGINAYLTVGWTNLDDEEIFNKINKYYDIGIRAFKIKVGSSLKDDLRRLELFRKKFGSDTLLMVDSNQIWGVNEAIEYMSKLAKYKIKWIEEPTARDDIIGHKTIAKNLEKYEIGVAAGEQVQSPTMFKQMLSNGSIQYCQIDATRMAGINEVLPIILLANKFNVPICPHGGGIGLCNMVLHFSIWDQILIAPNKNQLVEYLEFLQDEVFVKPIKLYRGKYKLPENSGWGIEITADFINNYAFPNGNFWKKRVNERNL